MVALDPPQGFESQDRMLLGKRVFLMFPPFHVGLVDMGANATDLTIL